MSELFAADAACEQPAVVGGSRAREELLGVVASLRSNQRSQARTQLWHTIRGFDLPDDERAPVSNVPSDRNVQDSHIGIVCSIQHSM